VRQHAKELGVDPGRIVAAGASAGGHIAICVAQFPGIIAAGEDPAISSIPNLVVAFNPVLDTSTNGYGSSRFPSYADALALSPAHHLTNGLPPMLSFHGTADNTVPYANETRYQAASRAAGNIYELVTFPGRDHGFFNDQSFRSKQPDTDYLTTIASMERFLQDHGFLHVTNTPASAAH
jgi:acetyl esterase/lipase